MDNSINNNIYHDIKHVKCKHSEKMFDCEIRDDKYYNKCVNVFY